MLLKSLSLALLIFIPFLSHAETQSCDTNKMLQTTQKVMDFFYYNPDPAILESALSDQAKITYNANGKRNEMGKKQCIAELTKALTTNVTSSRPTQLSYEITGPNTVKIIGKIIETRKGEGINEAGPGTYLTNLTGYYTFNPEGDGVKIVKFHHQYTKTKIG